MPISCSYFLHLSENLYPLPRILLPERNKEGLCLCQNRWKEAEEPWGSMDGITAALGLRGAISAAGINWGFSSHLGSALQGILQHGRRHWVDQCVASIHWGKDNESGTDKSCSPYGSGWRRLDCAMGKSVCMYF